MRWQGLSLGLTALNRRKCVSGGAWLCLEDLKKADLVIAAANDELVDHFGGANKES